MSTFEPSPDINCPLCGGHGYTLKPKNGYAHATICSCIPECPRCEDGVVRKMIDGVMRSGRCRCQKLPDRIAMFNGLGSPPDTVEKTSVIFNGLTTPI